jgi:hypothetical protein
VAVIALAVGARPDPVAAKGVAAKVRIEPWPGGLRGTLKSAKPALCSEGRRVAVFRQAGEVRRPGRDERVGSDLASRAASDYQWSVTSTATGRFYARVEEKRGCEPALSGAVGAEPLAAGEDSGGRSYPPCGPYVSEATTPICRIENLHFDLDRQSYTKSCSWGDGGGDCPGRAISGPFPWGLSGPTSRFYASMQWFHDVPASVRRVNFITYQTVQGGPDVANIFGFVSNAGSPRFSVTDAVAPGERPAAESDHFYTPELPGQGPGEVGGPLYLNVQNGSGLNLGADAWINGYLFLKP